VANVIGSGIARTIVDAEGDPVNVSDTGNLMVDIGAASISGDLSVNLTQTDKVSIWGNEQADGEGTARALLTDSDGHLQVDVLSATLGTVSVQSNSANLATQSTLSDIDTDTGNIASAIYEDDGTFNLNSSKGIAIMGYAGTQSITADDVGVLACTASGKLIVSIGHTSATVPIQGDSLLGGSTYNETLTTSLMAGTVRNDVLDALVGTNNECAPLQVDAQGALYTTHGITGMQSDNNEGVDDSTAEVLKSSTACKRVDMQADSANTGYIYVGGSDVSATKGIRLAPGDFYSIDCDNTADIYVLASVDEEDIHFTYYT